MIQLSTLEITDEGELLSASTPSSSSLQHLLPAIGENIKKHWDEPTNLQLEGFLSRVFSEGYSIEFSILLHNQSFQCTAFNHLPQKALLHLKPISTSNEGDEKEAAYLTDLSEKIRMEERLKLVDFIFSKTSVPIIIGLEDGSFLDVNETALSLYGYTKEEMGKLTVNDVRLNSKKSYAALWAEIKTLKKVAFESIHKKKDGSLMQVEVIANYFKYGNWEVSCTFIADVTEKKRVEEALRTSNERYENASISTSDVVWEWDLTNDSNYYSANYTRLFGHPISGLEYGEDNCWRRNLHPEDKERVLEQEAEVVKGAADKWEVEYRLRKADGEYAIVLDRGFSIKDATGKVVKLVGAMQDVTKQKEKENERLILLTELVENNKELLQFSYITTHNLRAPLTNLISICKRVDIKLIEDFQTKRLIEGFKQSAMLLNDTLNDLIKILIIKENRHLEKRELSFGDTLEKVKNSISTILLKNVVKIEADFTEASMVQFSSVYLESIFLNLLTNSIKYAHPTRYPLIQLKTTKERDGSTKLKFSDNGIGMNMERVKNKIFGLYQRFHNNADAKGIGLYLVHSQVTTLGGKIEVDSEVGVGTTFTITFK